MSDNYLDALAGEGLDAVKDEDTQRGLLLIAQKLSQVTDTGLVKEGNWYNSLTQEDYGPTVRVIVVAMEKYWFVWAADQSGLLGRYAPGSIEVTGDTYTGMIDASGNRVVDTLCYACVLPDHPDAGVVILTSTRGSMKYFRSWNTAIKLRRLPSGKPAPLFGTVWILTTCADKDKKGRPYYSLRGGIKPEGFITENTLVELVRPARQLAVTSMDSIELKTEPTSTETEF